MPSTLAARTPADVLRALARGVLAFGVALGLLVLPVLAHASPPDPSWLVGVWDGADGDEVVVLVCSGVEAVSAPIVFPGWLGLHPIAQLAPSGGAAFSAPLRDGVRSRAPPLAA